MHFLPYVYDNAATRGLKADAFPAPKNLKFVSSLEILRTQMVSQ